MPQPLSQRNHWGYATFAGRSVAGLLLSPSIPFVQVLAPYDSEDARGLLKAAIRDPDPVVFLENEMLYGTAFPVTPQIMDKDFVLPLGKAKIMREGSDVTLLAFGKLVGYNLEAAEALAQVRVGAKVRVM